MGVVDSVSAKINYNLTSADHVIKKTVTNPSAVKKLLQIASRVFQGYDLYTTGIVKDRKITQVTKGTVELIDFYSSYKNLMYWINPFSKENLNVEKLESSLLNLENDKVLKALNEVLNEDLKNKLRLIFKDVMAKESYSSKGQVKKVVEDSLKKHGFHTSFTKDLVEKIVIEQKSRPLVQRISMVCFTLVDLGSNLITLKKWEILDLSLIADSIGKQSRVFAFVIKLGVDTVLGTVASAGLVLVVGHAIYRVIIYQSKLSQTNFNSSTTKEEKEQIRKDLRHAVLDLVSGTGDLISTAMPLLFVLNPPVIIGLSIFAKGTGLICILVR